MVVDFSSDIPAPIIYDPHSIEYKKARKNYVKSTRARHSDESYEWTCFRAAEKRYKARFPPPDLSDVLDLALLDNDRLEEIKCGKWVGRADAYSVRSVKLRKADHDEVKATAFSIPEIPGLVILPNYISHESQRELVRWSLCEHARPPNETNLDTHYIVPEEGIWARHVQSLLSSESQVSSTKEQYIQPRMLENEPTSYEIPGPRQLVTNIPADPGNFTELAKQPKLPATPSLNARPMTASELLPRLRWANIGWFYHWGTKQYDFGKGKVEPGKIISRLCKGIVKAIHWDDVFGNDMSWQTREGGSSEITPEWLTWDKTYDAGIINFYQLKDTLMGHVDRSEVCATSPLVSISLGNAAVFLIGGMTRDVKPLSILLRSGDVVVMAGPGCRRAYHGVPRILEGSLPLHLRSSEFEDEEWHPFENYLETTRINMNVRQVFPIGFCPPIEHLNS